MGRFAFRLKQNEIFENLLNILEYFLINRKHGVVLNGKTCN